MSKNRRSGLVRRSDLNLNPADTSIATRVKSPRDQKRTELTLLTGVRGGAARDTAARSRKPGRSLDLLRSPEVQPAILVDELLHCSRLHFHRVYLNRFCFGCGNFRRLSGIRGAPRFSVTLAHLINVILRLRIRRDPFVLVHRASTRLLT